MLRGAPAHNRIVANVDPVRNAWFRQLLQAGTADAPARHRFSLGGSRYRQRSVAHRCVPRHEPEWQSATVADGRRQIGRATCRERVCQYVEISEVAVSVKKKTDIKD